MKNNNQIILFAEVVKMDQTVAIGHKDPRLRRNKIQKAPDVTVTAPADQEKVTLCSGESNLKPVVWWNEKTGQTSFLISSGEYNVLHNLGRKVGDLGFLSYAGEGRLSASDLSESKWLSSKGCDTGTVGLP